jgi:hypothetical protein
MFKAMVFTVPCYHDNLIFTFGFLAHILYVGTHINGTFNPTLVFLCKFSFAYAWLFFHNLGIKMDDDNTCAIPGKVWNESWSWICPFNPFDFFLLHDLASFFHPSLPIFT